MAMGTFLPVLNEVEKASIHERQPLPERYLGLSDEEMAARIAAHRAERPAGWLTVEEPYALEAAVAAADVSHTVVVDCLTLWTANALARDGDPELVLAAATSAAGAAADREALTIAVSNEVGLGIVPLEPLSRAYRDLLGSVNRAWVEASAEAAFVVAGRALVLRDAAGPLPR